MDEYTAARLATTASGALIQAMMSDTWEPSRDRFAGILARGGEVAATRTAARLDTSRARIAGADEGAFDRVSALEEGRWAGRLEVELSRDPALAELIREFVAAVHAGLRIEAGAPAVVQQRPDPSGRAPASKRNP